jgi:amidase
LDGGKEYFDTFNQSGEPPVPQVQWILDQIPNNGRPYSIAETFQLNLQRDAFRQNLLMQWNNTAGKTGTNRPVDAIICPVAPTLAPRHNETRWWGYTSYWNLADYPAAVFPVKRVDSLASDELPVCLQIVGRRLNEEKTLAMLNVVDKILHA